MTMGKVTSKYQVTVPTEGRDSRVGFFDQATERHCERPSTKVKRSTDRGWKREDLYDRDGIVPDAIR
jgi:hypothetical protein